MLNDSGEFIDIDSIDFMTMIISVEEEFNVEFPDDLLIMILVNSVEQLVKIVSTILDEE